MSFGGLHCGKARREEGEGRFTTGYLPRGVEIDCHTRVGES